MLHSQVPLVVDGWLYFLIPEAEDLPVKAGEVGARSASRGGGDDTVRSSGSRQRLQLILGLELTRRCTTVEWWVDWQAQVCAGAFKVVGDGESAANYGVAIEACGRPGKSEARLEGL